MGGRNTVQVEKTLQKAALEQYLAGGLNVDAITTQVSLLHAALHHGVFWLCAMIGCECVCAASAARVIQVVVSSADSWQCMPAHAGVGILM